MNVKMPEITARQLALPLCYSYATFIKLGILFYFIMYLSV